MKAILQLVAISVSILFITGCVSIVPLQNIDGQVTGSGLSEQQVKEAIHSGAESAGWTIEKEGPGMILATYVVRTHTVAVNIRYTENNYSINYAYSNNMKVHCTDQEKAKGVMITNWPGESCGGARPQLIHKAYNKWIEELKSEIDMALSST